MRSISFVVLLGTCHLLWGQSVKVAGTASGPIPYGLAQLEKHLPNKIEYTGEVPQPGTDLVLLTATTAEKYNFIRKKPGDLLPEGYHLFKQDKQYILVGKDEKGIMYGLLEIADQLKFGSSFDQLQEKKVSPRFPFRAIKFNLPYMAYRSHASIVQHYTTCRDLDFWERYLDMMAQNRFNVLSLWSLHLYHYMVIPENFPEASQFNEVEMGDWKRFWSTLFKMAKDRGIETYIINWNTCSCWFNSN